MLNDSPSLPALDVMFRKVRTTALFFILFGPSNGFSQDGGQLSGSAFVDIRKVDPTIVIELRYASSNNPTRQPLYPQGMPALVRFGVAQRLASVQKYLKARGYGLKIWDAYRPKAAQE